MRDELGNRMKEFYEDRTRIKLPRRTFTIIRVDGKAFHTYTKGLERPFDAGLIQDMNETAAYLCQNIQGAKLAYVQSDEISVIVTDFDDLGTHAWFDNNLQKMASVAASMATAKFNQLRAVRGLLKGTVSASLNKLAMFDARVFQIPFIDEVVNYLIWRQVDAVRNSISSVAQSMYSHRELNGKNTNDMQEMIFQKGTNWNDYDSRLKRGGVITKVKVELNNGDITYSRNKWKLVELPTFSKDKESIKNIILNKNEKITENV
jgi:tRNA(His) guanylyltransferase